LLQSYNELAPEAIEMSINLIKSFSIDIRNAINLNKEEISKEKEQILNENNRLLQNKKIMRQEKLISNIYFNSNLKKPTYTTEEAIKNMNLVEANKFVMSAYKQKKKVFVVGKLIDIDKIMYKYSEIRKNGEFYDFKNENDMPIQRGTINLYNNEILAGTKVKLESIKVFFLIELLCNYVNLIISKEKDGFIIGAKNKVFENFAIVLFDCRESGKMLNYDLMKEKIITKIYNHININDFKIIKNLLAYSFMQNISNPKFFVLLMNKLVTNINKIESVSNIMNIIKNINFYEFKSMILSFGERDFNFYIN